MAVKKRKTPKKITESYLHNAGLHYLQRFTASTGHFRTVMTRKIDRSCRVHPDQDRDKCLELLEKLVDKFSELKLLDDLAYARGMVNSLKQRGLSERALYARLQMKGLRREEIASALQNYEEENPEDNEFEAALRFAQRKRLGPFAKPEDREGRRDRHMAALARAGFGYDVCKKVLEFSE